MKNFNHISTYASVLDKLRLVKNTNPLYYKKALTQLNKIGPLIPKFLGQNRESKVVSHYLWEKHNQYILRNWEIQILAIIGEMLDIWFIEEKLLINQDINPGRSYYIVGQKENVIMGIKLYRYIVNVYDLSMTGIRKRIKVRNVRNRNKRRKGQKHGEIVSIGAYASNQKRILLYNLSTKLIELLDISKQCKKRPDYKLEMENIARKNIKLAFHKSRGLYVNRVNDNPKISTAFGNGIHKILKYEPTKYKSSFPGSPGKK